MSLVPLFTMRAIADRIDRFVEEREQNMVQTLSYIGEETVNMARETDPFKDHTGNLRSSIGYVVVKNGKPVKLFVRKAKADDKGAGVAAGKALAAELGDEYNEGFVLIVFAGMEYAAAVESKGYDVITGNVQTSSELYSFLKQALGLT